MQDFAPEGVEAAAENPPTVFVKSEAVEGTSSDHSASGDFPRTCPTVARGSTDKGMALCSGKESCCVPLSNVQRTQTV